MTALLPNADWLSHPGLHRVVNALRAPQGDARIVGGAVRDALLGLAVADIDIATPLRPAEVVERLEGAGIKAVPTGIAHGTITAVADDRSFEVTTLRRDVSTDGRRATVAFSDDWKEDAGRRDFTINALYADPDSRTIFDYFGGLPDLKAGIVRFIGDPAERIAEDHLRILRFFRFHARFGKTAPDRAALAACSAGANSLMALSRERIADELLKLLALPHPEDSIEAMRAAGIFSAFLPEIAIDAGDRLRRLIAREGEIGALPDAGRRLNALLPADPATVDAVAARLKLSNRMRGELAARASETSPAAGAARAIAYRRGIDVARDIFLLHGGAEWTAGCVQLTGWTVPLLPIKGGELVQMGLHAGPLVAKTLQAIEGQWIEEGFPGRTRTAEIAAQAVAEALAFKKA